MARTNEYLVKRCAINELVLLNLGEILILHFPALVPQLKEIGKAWGVAIEKLDEDMPDSANN